MQDKKAFGNYIFAKRKERNLTQADIAEKLYVTATTVSKWERGVCYPDITLISQLCDILQITEHELITAGDDSETRDLKQYGHKIQKLKKWYFYGLSICYAVALLVCFIVNLAVSKNLSWFFIVLTSILTAFSLFPSVSKFVRKGKILVVSLSFLIALTSLLATCYFLTDGSRWLGITFVAILFAYAVVFVPLLISLYNVPEFFKRHAAVLSIAVDTVLLIVLLAVCLSNDGNNFAKSLAVVAFYFIPVMGTAVLASYVKINRYFKAAILSVLWGGIVFASNTVVDKIFGLESQNSIIKLTDWTGDYINANVTAVVFIAALLLAFVFLLIGIAAARKRKQNNKSLR